MKRQLDALAKHGLAADGSLRPTRPDWTIDQGWADYTPAEHATWRTLFERQRALLPGRACDEFLQGMRDPDVPWRQALKLVEHLSGDPVVLTLIKDGDHRLSTPEDIVRLQAAVAGMATAP